MQSFIEKALKKLPKLTDDQIHQLVQMLAGEYETLEAVINSVSQGVLICNSASILVQYNKAAERLLPLSADIADKPIWAVIDDGDIALFVRNSLLSQEPVYGKEFYLNSSSGTKIISLSIFPLVKKNSLDETLITIDDFTEKRTKDSRLRRAENLASLTTLAAGVAHEIKNPLGAMSIHIQLLQKALTQLEGSTKPSVEKHLAVVNEEMERLNKIVVDFLFAVRPMNLQPILSDVNKIIKDVAEFIKVEFDNAHMSLDLLLDETLPQVELDERYTKQALLNLVTNAEAAMKSGGKLKIETHRKNDDVIINIADTGCGIPKDQLSKIFEPYFTTKSNGTGLGLTLTYKIIKELGGEVSVFSAENKGTTFTITLPIPQKELHLLDEQSVTNKRNGEN